MLQRKSETRDAAEMSWHAVITPSLLLRFFFHFERPKERTNVKERTKCALHMPRRCPPGRPETCVHDTPHLNVRRPRRPSVRPPFGY